MIWLNLAIDWFSIFFRFLRTGFLIFRAWAAYFKVLIVSSLFVNELETQAIIIVLALPPSESFNSLVSLLSQYGMNFFFPFFLHSVKVLIQLPRANKDLLMFDPSMRLVAFLISLHSLSDPAKSTILNLLVSQSLFSLLSPIGYLSTWI